jgi:uncharacterized membrane protein
MKRRIPHGDDGTIIPMMIGFLVVVSLLLLVIIDATVLFTTSRAVGTYADGAALAAAQEIDKPAFYGAGGILGNSLLPLGQSTHAQAQAAADRYLADSGAARTFPGIHADVTVDADKPGTPPTNQVTVTVTAPQIPLPFTKVVGIGALDISNTATAVLRCGEGAANTVCAAG